MLGTFSDIDIHVHCFTSNKCVGKNSAFQSATIASTTPQDQNKATASSRLLFLVEILNCPKKPAVRHGAVLSTGLIKCGDVGRYRSITGRRERSPSKRCMDKKKRHIKSYLQSAYTTQGNVCDCKVSTTLHNNNNYAASQTSTVLNELPVEQTCQSFNDNKRRNEGLSTPSPNIIIMTTTV